MSKPWTMVTPSGQPMEIPTDFLVSVITDVTSWHNFLVMLYTGEPAEMQLRKDDGQVEILKVISTELIGRRPTYDDPRRS